MDWSRIPSLSALRAFDALARHGSATAAARDLNVTHAAIAQHLRALERHFNEKLAFREGQGMRLTDTGQELALALCDGFDRVADGVTRILDRNADRPVTVTLTPSFAETWLMPRIGQFWAAYPDVEIRLVPSIERSDLRRDGIDIGIRFGDGNWSGVESELLDLSPFVVVAAKGYSSAETFADLGDPAQHKWFFSSGALEQRVWGRAIGVDFNQVRAKELVSNSLVLSAVRAGLGLGIQPRALVQPDLDSGQFVALHEGDPEGIGYHLITRRDVLSPGARVFRAWLRRAAQAQV